MAIVFMAPPFHLSSRPPLPSGVSLGNNGALVNDHGGLSTSFPSADARRRVSTWRTVAPPLIGVQGIPEPAISHERGAVLALKLLGLVSHAEEIPNSGCAGA